MSEPRRQFSLEFKREAVQMIVHPGLSVAEAARRLDVRDSLLRKWRKQFEDVLQSGSHQMYDAQLHAGLGERRLDRSGLVRNFVSGRNC